MHCNICGAPYDETDKYCRNCGQRFLKQPVRVIPSQAADPVQYKRTSFRLKFLACSVVVLALLAAVLVQVAPGLLTNGLSPKDLGVKWTDEDYKNVVEKCGVAFDTAPAGTDRSKIINRYSGNRQIDWTITESELTALLNGGTKPGYWPVSRAQVKLHAGGVVEGSCMVNPAKLMTYPVIKNSLPQEIIRYVSGIPFEMPVYFKATVSFTGPKQADVTLLEINASGMALTDMAANEQANLIVESIIGQLLAEAEPVNIESFETAEGSIRLRGAWYTEFKRMPAE